MRAPGQPREASETAPMDFDAREKELQRQLVLLREIDSKKERIAPLVPALNTVIVARNGGVFDRSAVRAFCELRFGSSNPTAVKRLYLQVHSDKGAAEHRIEDWLPVLEASIDVLRPDATWEDLLEWIALMKPMVKRFWVGELSPEAARVKIEAERQRADYRSLDRRLAACMAKRAAAEAEAAATAAAEAAEAAEAEPEPEPEPEPAPAPKPKPARKRPAEAEAADPPLAKRRQCTAMAHEERKAWFEACARRFLAETEQRTTAKQGDGARAGREIATLLRRCAQRLSAQRLKDVHALLPTKARRHDKGANPVRDRIYAILEAADLVPPKHKRRRWSRAKGEYNIHTAFGRITDFLSSVNGGNLRDATLKQIEGAGLVLVRHLSRGAAKAEAFDPNKPPSPWIHDARTCVHVVYGSPDLDAHVRTCAKNPPHAGEPDNPWRCHFYQSDWRAIAEDLQVCPPAE